MSALTKSQLADLRTAVDLPEDVADLAAAANWDLYNGPNPDEDAISFESAMRGLTRWCRDNLPHRMWLDTEADIWLTSEPESWEDEDGNVFEPMWEDYREYDRRSLVCALFGRELGLYL